MWALLPIKALRGAKKRLSELLSEDERAGLVRAMASDVLRALMGAEGLDGVVVLSSDPDVQALAEQAGARFLPEGDAKGLNPALEQAAETLAGEGINSILIVHGDLPLASADEIDAIATAHGPISALGAAITIVPSREDGGSNTMAISLPAPISLEYGADSFAKHCRAAEAAGITPKVLELHGIGLDIDRPGDLLAFLAEACPGKTIDYLVESGIAERLEGVGQDPDRTSEAL